MGALQFKIKYNGNDTSISNLFEGVGEGSNQDTNNYQNIGDSYYSQNYKGFYYLKRNKSYHNLTIHINCPDLDNFFAIQSNGTTIDLPQPVLKGCYPCMSSTPKGDYFLRDYGYIDNYGKLFTKDVYQNIQLPLVVIALVCGGGGGGGGTSANTPSRRYSAGSGGASKVGIFYLKTHNYDNNKLYLHYEVGKGGKGGIGQDKNTTPGSNGSPSYLWLSTSDTSVEYTKDNGTTYLLYRSSYGTGGKAAWFEFKFPNYIYNGGAAGETENSYYSQNLDYIWKQQELGTAHPSVGADNASDVSNEIKTSYTVSLSPFVKKSFSGSIPIQKQETEVIGSSYHIHTYYLFTYGGNNSLYLPAVYWRKYTLTQDGITLNSTKPETPSIAYGTGGAGAISLSSSYANKNGTAGTDGMIRLIW